MFPQHGIAVFPQHGIAVFPQHGIASREVTTSNSTAESSPPAPQRTGGMLALTATGSLETRPVRRLQKSYVTLPSGLRNEAES